MIILDRAGRALAGYLTRPSPRSLRISTSLPLALLEVLQPGDVLLVEGDTRISVAIKYLTQSSWSHAALCIARPRSADANVLLEVDVNEGVRLVPLSMYARMHTRICRAVGLSDQEIQAVIDHALAKVGRKYDMHHIWDLTRYLFPLPPVPTRWRRRLLAFGSGDPTRAICSTLIADAFHSVSYPILPEVVLNRDSDVEAEQAYAELRHIQEHGLYMPRDFDVSPYFQIIKPTLAQGFDPHTRKKLAGSATSVEA